MPASRRSRWLSLAVATVVWCLLPACTGRSEPGEAPSSRPSLSAEPTSPGEAPDYVAMQRELQQRLTGGDLSHRAVRAVLVSVDGDVVLSYYRNREPTEHAHVWSVTKSVMSILVGITIDEGRLRSDQTLAELLPAHVKAMTDEVKSVTLRQLLTMTAGIQGGPGMVALFDLVRGKDATDALVGSALVATPGATFIYSDAAAHLVGVVLRNAVDRPLLDYARVKLFDPLGIDTRPAWQGTDVEAGLRRPGFAWGMDGEGTNTGCCALKLTAPDMLKIGQLYLEKGRWQGSQIVSSDWVKESTTNQLTREQTTDGPYGYFWWVGTIASRPFFGAFGAYGQRIIVMPDSRLVVVIASDESGFEQLSEAFVTTFDDVIFKPISQR